MLDWRSGGGGRRHEGKAETIHQVLKWTQNDYGEKEWRQKFPTKYGADGVAISIYVLRGG